MNRYLEWMKKDFDRQIELVNNEINELQRKADGVSGKFNKIIQVFDLYKTKVPYYKDYKYMPAEGIYLDKKNLYEKAFEVAKKQHEENIPLIEENKRVFAQIVSMIENAGIASSSTSLGKKGFKTVKYPWVVELQSKVSFDDLWCDCERHHNYLMEKNEVYIVEERKKRFADEEKEKQRIKYESKIKTLAVLSHKYGVSDFDFVLESILNKCKYLYLAHAMKKTRDDWRDGCYMVEKALNSFNVESDTDNNICRTISDLVNNWGGDGRVFRDCEYNYDILYAMVDKDLLADYNDIIELSD